GTVVALGAEVTRFKLGDAVCALVTGGGYAQYCLSHEATALPVPHGLDMVQAAALPETFFTVWSNVFDRAGLKRGETLLVHGGTGGIGTTAIQLGKAFGATVITTAGSPEKCTACLKLGADLAIDYKTQDFVAEVKSATGGKGANVILDVVGGAYIQRNYEAAAVEGRIVQIAFQDGSKVNVDFMRLMLKRLTHTGSTLRARPVADKEAIANALTQHVIPLISAGTVRPLIDCAFPLEKANEAHARMDTSAHIGKIMLIVA
ncbi:MAG TPA: NAD(P)H-quinone oxidoreductase, partial [Xanthobacteraceae bacterium]|nr:NAD(P)H-quinone oxidoreductase [Xanthobacteraceae bacterium]